MNKLVLLVGLVFASACGSKAENALSDFEGFKTKMCECKDAACVEGVEKDMKSWEEKMKDSDVKKSDLSEGDQAKLKEIRKELRECRRNAKKEGDTDAPK